MMTLAETGEVYNYIMVFMFSSDYIEGCIIRWGCKMVHVCQMVQGWFVVLGFGLSCQEQLQQQMAREHMRVQLKGIGEPLQTMVKAEPPEEDMNEEWWEEGAGPLGQAEEGAPGRLGGEGGRVGRQALQQWVVPLPGEVVSDSCS